MSVTPVEFIKPSLLPCLAPIFISFWLYGGLVSEYHALSGLFRTGRLWGIGGWHAPSPPSNGLYHVPSYGTMAVVSGVQIRGTYMPGNRDYDRCLYRHLWKNTVCFDKKANIMQPAEARSRWAIEEAGSELNPQDSKIIKTNTLHCR